MFFNFLLQPKKLSLTTKLDFNGDHRSVVYRYKCDQSDHCYDIKSKVSTEGALGTPLPHIQLDDRSTHSTGMLLILYKAHKGKGTKITKASKINHHGLNVSRNGYIIVIAGTELKCHFFGFIRIAPGIASL